MLEFETSSGNMYAWDDDVGLFIPFSLTMKAVKEEISNKKSSSREEIIEKLKRYFDPEDIAFCHDWLKKWEKIKLKNNVIQKINAAYIKTYILKNGLKQLTLNVTEDCNFRCTYCLFSDKYQYTR